MFTEFSPSTIGDLTLTRLPSGEFAWLRAELDTAIADADQLDQDLARRLGRERVSITPAGRRALDDDRRARALEALFGPWPRVSEVAA